MILLFSTFLNPYVLEGPFKKVNLKIIFRELNLYLFKLLIDLDLFFLY